MPDDPNNPNNPFTHVFARVAPVCDRGGEVHEIGPFFELGCGHCLCQNCVLVSSKQCPLCKWVPHAAVSAMFSKYCDSVAPPACAVVAVPNTDGLRFNTFGFYLGASLAVEMCFLFLNRVYTQATAEHSVRSVFNSIGDTVPDQFVEKIVKDVHWRSLAIAAQMSYTPTPEAPLGDLASVVQQMRRGSGPQEAAIVLSRHIINVAVSLEGTARSHLFDPFGVGRCRLPYVATFSSDTELLDFLAARLGTGMPPDMASCPASSPLEVYVIQSCLPHATQQPSTRAPLPEAAAATAPPSCSRDLPVPAAFSWRPTQQPSIQPAFDAFPPPPRSASAATSFVSSLQEAALGMPEAPWLSGLHTSSVMDEHFTVSQHIAEDEALQRRQLKEWERVAAGTVRCTMYFRNRPVSPSTEYRPLWTRPSGVASTTTYVNPFLSLLQRTDRAEQAQAQAAHPADRGEEASSNTSCNTTLNVVGALDFSNSTISCPPSPGGEPCEPHRSVSCASQSVYGSAQSLLPASLRDPSTTADTEVRRRGAPTTVATTVSGATVRDTLASDTSRTALQPTLADELTRDERFERSSVAAAEGNAWRALRDWESIKYSFVRPRPRRG